MDEKNVQRINMQLLARLEKIEKENLELKRALSEFQWLIDVAKKIKYLGGIINEKSSKRIDRPQNF